MINRSVVIVRPKQSYIDWADQLDDSDVLPSADRDHTVYLVPEYDDDVEAMEILSRTYDTIFDAELEGWHTDESAWPSNRTFAMFREWFIVEFHSVVEDLCAYEVVDNSAA